MKLYAAWLSEKERKKAKKGKGKSLRVTLYNIFLSKSTQNWEAVFPKGKFGRKFL